MLGIRKSLSVHKNLDLDLDIPSSSKVKSPASGRRKLNLRRFRRTLLFRLGDSHTFNWTNPYSSWNCGSLQSNDLLEKEIFPDLLLKRAEMHVIEQMKMDANLDLDVICGIVSRVIDSYMFEKSPDTKFHSASDSKPNPSETRPDQPQSQAERDKSSPIEVPLDAIKLGCNEHEKRLLHTVVDPEELDVTFDDVTIDRDAKEIVKELFTLRKVLSSRGLKFIGSSGILLYGPPGTGKTHLSRAIAKDVGVNMLAITPADIESKWVGESQKAIGAAFSLARKLAPCVLFIEKVDALFGHRTSSSRRWEREAINQCLQEMDDIDTKHNSPLVVGATNRPLDLDEEFMRRLPHKVLFSLPTQHQRHEILQALVKQSDLDPSVSLEELSQTTAGYSRYDLKELCNQAVMISASEHFPNREDSKEDEDEKSTERLDNLILKPHHFAKALKRILSFFPDGATLETTGFAQKFNPNQGDGAGR
ncbi:AAA-domain-containing protein [Aspergillus sclerotioniger CBS 115572]|uniref:AAA-domain-containing protein n=1 Tax=Aspergillus sclerotioniger CBS 115572 TaxID=1450535 RepID=A0A317WSD3_9EURO|nr:AAA-domain-containing protein [Aspergillus sclerotioniger CBS 115572]PWY88057.1 AAA-domain-containing protein [Aspergillus sclerotioniger CBS 115572]